jgi:hypothetical protein
VLSSAHHLPHAELAPPPMCSLLVTTCHTQSWHHLRCALFCSPLATRRAGTTSDVLSSVHHLPHAELAPPPMCSLLLTTCHTQSWHHLRCALFCSPLATRRAGTTSDVLSSAHHLPHAELAPPPMCSLLFTTCHTQSWHHFRCAHSNCVLRVLLALFCSPLVTRRAGTTSDVLITSHHLPHAEVAPDLICLSLPTTCHTQRWCRLRPHDRWTGGSVHSRVIRCCPSTRLCRQQDLHGLCCSQRTNRLIGQNFGALCLELSA